MPNFLFGLIKAVVRRKLPCRGVPEFLPWPGAGADTLVVYAHEWGGSGRSRWLLKRVLWGQSPNRDDLAEAPDEANLAPDAGQAPLGPVDLLAPRYLGNPLTNKSPLVAAREFQERIHRQVASRSAAGAPYKHVILIGYSAGSLMLRKALVWGLGQIEDHRDPELARESQWTWALDPSGTKLNGTIARIVLIAGINRGWSLVKKPADMEAKLYVTYKVLEFLARTRLFGGFILSLERGQPFVADLRLQWLALAHRLAGLPPTFQLLGAIDDIVTRDDNKDVLALANANLVLVPESDHIGILHIHDPQIGRVRLERLTNVIKGVVRASDIAESNLDRRRHATEVDAASVNPDGHRVDNPITMIVLPAHGIRDNSDWCNRFRIKLAATIKTGRVLCPCESYGHFSILRFLLFSRQRMVRWFVDLYTESVAAVGNPHIPVHFVGHSNGTYLLARALIKYATIRVDRVVLTGSVVQRHFPWDEFHRLGRINSLRNERAAKDLVVGLGPGFYQQAGKLLPIGRGFFDIGNGGLRGFDRPPFGQDVERFYLAGGHGAGVAEDNLQHVVDFILDEPEKQRALIGKMPGYINLASNLCWLIWLLGIIVIVASLLVLPWWGALLVIIVLVLIINTV